jgi:hypothetical protein
LTVMVFVPVVMVFEPVQDIGQLLSKLVPPILPCLTDADSRVRYVVPPSHHGTFP